MPSDFLNRAREYEAAHRPGVPRSVLPRFHFTGKIGWLNDPNGFSLYKGQYHLFYQYNPYSVQWDAMHWGHAKSHDLIRWEYLPCAMAPDRDYDSFGCFSGSAVELEDGRQLLMYTGVRREGDLASQTQCLAVGDGTDYEKYDGNPVITVKMLPKGYSGEHFRDPKIWRQDGKYYAVAANLSDSEGGAVLLFESDDCLSWRFVCQLASSKNKAVKMWECPDFFPLDGVDVLLVSPLEIKDDDSEFTDGGTSLCLIGQQKSDGTFVQRSKQTVDYGLDFYAPQTTLTDDGRRVMIAWMQNWNTIDVRPTGEFPFYGQMTLPRELTVRDGRLFQQPVRELERYRKNRLELVNVPVSGKSDFTELRGRYLDMTVKIRPGGDEMYKSVTVNVAEGEDCAFSVTYTPSDNTIRVDRSRSGWNSHKLTERTFKVNDRGGEIALRFIVDRYSVELFINDGEQAGAFVIYSPESADGVTVESDGNTFVDIERYTLEI